MNKENKVLNLETVVIIGICLILIGIGLLLIVVFNVFYVNKMELIRQDNTTNIGYGFLEDINSVFYFGKEIEYLNCSDVLSRDDLFQYEIVFCREIDGTINKYHVVRYISLYKQEIINSNRFIIGDGYNGNCSKLEAREWKQDNAIYVVKL